MPSLREMARGVCVIALDANPAEVIDEKMLQIKTLDFNDAESVILIAKQYQVGGVYPMNDHAIRTAAKVCEELGLTGMSAATAENFLDKTRMRLHWKKSGLNQPEFRTVLTIDEAVSGALEIGFPLIVKPAASGGGGRGVIRVADVQALLTAFPESVLANRYSDSILIEECLVGVESSVEMVFIEGKGRVVAMSTKEKAESNYQVATTIQYPAQLDDMTTSRIAGLCDAAGRSLGMDSGVAHFEVITNSFGIPSLVEVGGRAGGGHTFHPIASHVSGVSYPRLVADVYLGRFKRVERALDVGLSRRGAIYAFPITFKHGTIKDIYFDPSVISINGTQTEIWKAPGDRVTGLKSSLDRLGCVLALAQTFEDAEKASLVAMQKLVITVTEDTELINYDVV